MKTMKNFLSMAALALMGAMMTGCSSDDNFDNPQQPENKSKVVTLTTTVGFADDGTTRALTIEGNKGVKTFAVDDQIAVIYTKNGGTVTKAVSEKLISTDIASGSKSATFTVTLDDPDKTKEVTYIYPAAMAGETGVDLTKLNTQEGTFDALQSKYDLCTKSGAWNGENLPSLTLENQLAILAITLKDNAATPAEITDNITSMVVSDGANAYTVNRSATAGPIYVAILPTSGATISVTATDGSKNYIKSLTNKTYEVSNGYNVSWKMPEVADLSMLNCAGIARASRWTANCYMVHTAGYYMLPLVYGNAIKNGATNAAAYTGVSGQLVTFTNHAGKDITDPWIKNNKRADDKNITVTTADLLWQDADGLITNVDIIGDYLTLTVGKNAAVQEGNAVVAAKDGSGNIVWSWHIWVTEQTFATLTTVNTGNHTYRLTPVNLGWVGAAVSRSYNTFYQWGRKDPFIPSTGTANTNHTVYNISNAPVTGLTFESSTIADIADNIKNPTTFYYVSDKPNTSTAYNLWDAQQTSAGDNIATATVKTVYDPCPAGFCVPTGNLYYYIKNGDVTSGWNDNKGRNLTSVSPNVFFPAAGYRNNSGSLTHVGSYGYYWSASPSSSNSDYGRRLGVLSDSWNWGGAPRAFGFPVRPVAEE